jgi:hypothetical protein
MVPELSRFHPQLAAETSKAGEQAGEEAVVLGA